ncbi:hypothetical protein EKD04_019845 [Chloroflexales bacterium ZM16-3]|nr:hypothetical protein [Chloroflexales bacterium ZM16-3]
MDDLSQDDLFEEAVDEPSQDDLFEDDVEDSDDEFADEDEDSSDHDGGDQAENDEPVGAVRPPVDLQLAPDSSLVDKPLRYIRKRPSMFEPLTGKDWEGLKSSEKKHKLWALQRECLRKEEAILSLIKLRKAAPRQLLPPGVLADAKQLFGIAATWKKQGVPTGR